MVKNVMVKISSLRYINGERERRRKNERIHSNVMGSLSHTKVRINNALSWFISLAHTLFTHPTCRVCFLAYMLKLEKSDQACARHSVCMQLATTSCDLHK